MSSSKDEKDDSSRKRPLSQTSPVPSPSKSKRRISPIKPKGNISPSQTADVTKSSSSSSLLPESSQPPSLSLSHSSSSTSSFTATTEIVNLSEALNLTNGMELLVLWEVEANDPLDDENDGDENDTSTSSTSSLETSTTTDTTTNTSTSFSTIHNYIKHWWPCTLQISHPLRTHRLADTESEPSTNEDAVECVVHTLRYVAMEELGFEECEADVCFIGDHILYDINEAGRLIFKSQGDDWVPDDNFNEFFDGAVEGEEFDEGDDEGEDADQAQAEYGFLRTREGLQFFLDGIINSSSASAKFDSLTLERKLFVAEVIVKSKERIIESVMKRLEGIERITSEHMKGVMEDIASSVRDIKRDVSGASQEEPLSHEFQGRF